MTKCFGVLGEHPYVNSKSSCHKKLFAKCYYRQLCKSQVRTVQGEQCSKGALRPCAVFVLQWKTSEYKAKLAL